MTNKKACRLTWEMWTWLALNPGKIKENYPLFFIDKINMMREKCPLCEFHRKDTTGNLIEPCLPCPIHKTGNNCFLGNSSWRTWQDASGKGNKTSAKQAARYIAVTAMQAYFKLKENNE